MTPPRVFVIGTDTEVGKTTVSVALLHAARRAGKFILPFKPAVSGDLTSSSDHARLARAAQRETLTPDAISVHRFEPPLAPGLIEDNHPFFDRRRSLTGDVQRATRSAMQQLLRLEAENRPDLTLIEGAGGLHVPMPGGTWLEDWVTAFGARPLVVARAGLGTINHTTLTVEALRHRGTPPLAFILNEIEAVEPSALQDNRRVLEARLEIDCLGILPNRPQHPDADDATQWLAADWIHRLTAL